MFEKIQESVYAAIHLSPYAEKAQRCPHNTS